jgi:hypothetical protein
MRSKPLLGSLTVDSLYAFRLPIFPNKPHYDDDAQLLDFQPMPDGGKLLLNRISNAAAVLGGARDGLHFLVWKRTDSTFGTYGTPSALGTTRKLTKLSTVETGIELCESAPNDCRKLPNNTFAVASTPDAARDAKSHAAVFRFSISGICAMIRNAVPSSRRTRRNRPSTCRMSGPRSNR